MPNQMQIDAALLQAVAEQDYFRNRPWERGGNIMAGDMFGGLQDNPLLRLSREDQYNRANAEEEIQARTAPGAMRPWENQEDVASDVNAQWNVPLARPGSHDIRSVGGSLYERNPMTGDWQIKAVAPTSGRQQNKTALERNTELFLKQLADAEASMDPVEKAMLIEQANITKSWLEKQGKFAPPPPPKPPTETIGETVRQIENPMARWDTNAIPTLSLTNSSHRVTRPLAPAPAPSSPFEVGLKMGGLTSPTNSPATNRYRIRLKP